MEYCNYHKHTHYSNLSTLDCIVKPIDYINRATELGHNTYFCLEHGGIGNIYESFELCKKNNLKLIVGLEAYYVHDRKEKNNSNYHLIIIALNHNAYLDLNEIISESNISGFYYKPRIDDELLFKLNPNDFIITTACIGGRLRENEGMNEWIIKMKEHFKNNFYFEIQANINIKQIEYNKKILELSKKYNVELIHGCDTHYIQDSEYRDLFLKAKGIVYPEEEGFILDYPDSDTIFERYKIQCVFTKEQIEKALTNTLIFYNASDIEFNYDIKMPSISTNPKQEFKDIINKEWKKEKEKIPKERHKEYINAIKYEVDIIDKTNMEDYFILNYKMIKLAIEKYGGVITKTGRGSAPSFYVNKLLGFTTLDRLDSKIPLFPTRFMSIKRILETKSIPDIDTNLVDPIPFIKASKELLGEDNCYYMISYKPLQESSAFRLYCKSIDMNINEYNEIAKDLDKYKNNEKWGNIIKKSIPFIGVIESVSPSPCSTLLLSKPISREIGLLKVGNIICCNLTRIYL